MPSPQHVERPPRPLAGATTTNLTRARSSRDRAPAIYDMRHTFATWAIEGGVEASYLAEVMGTSIRELEDTYFRWLRRTDDQLRKVFDEYDLRAAAQTG
jgi:integrase